LGRGTGRNGLPLRVWVLESSGDLEAPLWVEALGCGNPNGCTRGDAVVAQRALVRFVPERTVELPLLLAAACAGVRCGAEERCEVRTGMCRPATEAVTLPWMGVVDAGKAAMDVGVGSEETGVDAGVDAVEDQGVDVGMEEVADTEVDAGADTGMAASVDIGLDVAMEASAEAGVDAGVDAGDVLQDAGVSSVQDVIRDSETRPDVGVDALIPADVGERTDAGVVCPEGMLLVEGRSYRFCMDRTEVTVAAYRACRTCSAPNTGTYCNWNASGRDNHPVNCVDALQADAYCASRGGRLPTEQEWQFAAQGPDSRTYPWGEAAPSNQLCWSGVTSRFVSGENGGTCAVGIFASGQSPFGMSDMSGNVWEWTSTSDSLGRVFRGGSWNFAVPAAMRAANRDSYTPSYRRDFVGFRCARGVP